MKPGMRKDGNTDAAGIIKPQPARWSEGLHDATEMMRKDGNMDAAGIMKNQLDGRQACVTLQG